MRLASRWPTTSKNDENAWLAQGGRRCVGVDIVASQVTLDTIVTCRLGRYIKARVTAMNKLMIAALASMLFLAIVPPAAARAATEVTMPDWQSMSQADLLWAAKNLTVNDPVVKAARQSLAEHVAARFLADPASTRTISLAQWGEFATVVSADLTAEQRGQWAGSILAAYVQDPNGLASLKTSGDIAGLTGILSKLGDKQAGVAVGMFMQGSTSWQQWLPADQAKLAGQISALGEVGSGARRVLVNYITTRYLADIPAVKSVAAKEWATLAGCLAQDLSAEARIQWMDKILGAYAGTAQAIAALPASDRDCIKGAVGSLIEGQEGSGIAVRFITQQIVWQSWSPADLEWLVGKFPAAEAERRKITDLMMAQLLSARKAAGSMSAEDWQRLAALVTPGLPAERCSQLLDGITAAFYGEAGGFQSLDPKGHGRIVQAMKALGAKAADIADLPVKFALEKACWQAWDPNDLSRLVAAVGNGKDDRAKSARVLLANHIQTKYLAGESAARSISCAQWKALAQRLGGDIPKDAQADWAEKLHGAFANDTKFLSSLTKEQVGDLAEAMKILGSPKAGVVVLAWMSSRPRSR
jgi:hypothetical protein